MKCPMTFQTEKTEGDEVRLAGAECCKEECAWWDEAPSHQRLRRCAIKIIAENLWFMSAYHGKSW